jgi:hypothetical protein
MKDICFPCFPFKVVKMVIVFEQGEKEKLRWTLCFESLVVFLDPLALLLSYLFLSGWFFFSLSLISKCVRQFQLSAALVWASSVVYRATLSWTSLRCWPPPCSPTSSPLPDFFVPSSYVMKKPVLQVTDLPHIAEGEVLLLWQYVHCRGRWTVPIKVPALCETPLAIPKENVHGTRLLWYSDIGNAIQKSSIPYFNKPSI